MTIQDVKIEFQSRLHNFYDTKEIQSVFELLANDIGFSKVDLVLNPIKELLENQLVYFLSSIKRLETQEPIQYIRGKADFYGLEFFVSSAVLVPRQETELLVDTIIKHTTIQNPFILDLGTGSGCIPITLTKHIPNSQVFALDISLQALEIAKKNAIAQNVEVTFFQGDMQNENCCNSVPLCDVIVSNPPYVCNSEQIKMKQNVLNFEPHIALFVPDKNPLIFYKAIAKIALQKLKQNGILYCEINEALGNETKELFQNFGFSNVKIINDLHGKQRFISAEWV